MVNLIKYGAFCAILFFSKEMSMDLRYFTTDEFACPCCKLSKINVEFADKLDAAREKSGIPFRVTSGYRCQKHNRAVGGKPDSAHTRGYAADIVAATSRERYLIIKALLDVGFNRIGIDVKRGFIHVDCDPDKTENLIWGY